MKTVNKFNTKLASNISKETTLSSFEILKAVDKFYKDESCNNIDTKLVLQDIAAIIDERARHGAYQCFNNGPSIALHVNGNKLSVTRLPFGKVVFTLTKKDGYQVISASLNKVMVFVYKIITDELNAKCFNSTIVEA